MATEFTPLSGLIGGALIGLAAALLMLAEGKIAGISGILGRSLAPERGDVSWRLAFLAGLPLGAWATQQLFPSTDVLTITNDATVLVLAGLLVGVGTQLGNGCTSGHGVCGLSRGSPRSLAATLVFLTTAVITVFLVRHVLGGRA